MSKKNQITTEVSVQELERIKNRISDVRDDLRNLLDEAAGIEEIAQRTVDDLESLIDGLSTYV